MFNGIFHTYVYGGNTCSDTGCHDINICPSLCHTCSYHRCDTAVRLTDTLFHNTIIRAIHQNLFLLQRHMFCPLYPSQGNNQFFQFSQTSKWFGNTVPLFLCLFHCVFIKRSVFYFQFSDLTHCIPFSFHCLHRPTHPATNSILEA